MLIPVIIFAACFGFGAAAAARWLPNLGAGPVAGLVFLVVCGLLGSALAIVGLRVYSMVETLKGAGFEVMKGAVLADDLTDMLIETGTILGLAAIAYLLAPQSRHERIAARAREASLPETD